jgi:hypothetical protein
MRHCAALRANRSSATSDPQLDGIGHALEDLYAPMLAEDVPEAWLRLLDGDGASRDPEQAGDDAPDTAE